MNWGNKLLVTFIVFATGMGYLVYRSTHVNYELVEKDYYKTELQYQQVIDATKLVNQLTRPVQLTQTTEGIVLQLPEELNNQAVSGHIWFYCSYDETKDKKFNLAINPGGKQLFSSSALHPGIYIAKISWSSNGKKYYSEKILTIR